MNKFKKILSPFNIFLIVVALLNVFSISAPLLLELGLETPAKVIYFIYSFFCHQIHYRSLHIFDHQYAWCTRDTFIWFGVLVAGLYVKYFKYKGIKWYKVIPFVIPIALDGGIQLIATMVGLSDDSTGQPFYASTNFSRMVTGGLLGIGIGLWVFPLLTEMFNDKVHSLQSSVHGLSSRYQKLPIVVLITFISLFVLYLGLIGLWEITSSEYEPINVLDSSSRFPADKDEWLVRRKNGLCPTDIEQGFIGLKCEE